MSFKELKRRVVGATGILKKRGIYRGSRRIIATLLEDTWVCGRAVEILGNRGRIDGCVFDLDNPVISTRLKSRFLTQTWEQEARHLIAEHLPLDLPVVELGASIGVVSCVTNRLLSNPVRHLVVEANTGLLPLLEENKSRNHCQFDVVNAALAYGEGDVTFYVDGSFNEGSVHQETARSITVPRTTLRDLVRRCGSQRINVICDIEGAELDLVRNEGDVLRKHVEWLVVELHNNARCTRQDTQTALEDLGFRLVEQSYHNYAYENSRTIT